MKNDPSSGPGDPGAAGFCRRRFFFGMIFLMGKAFCRKRHSQEIFFRRERLLQRHIYKGMSFSGNLFLKILFFCIGFFL
jgi:hypothetical protein